MQRRDFNKLILASFACPGIREYSGREFPKEEYFLGYKAVRKEISESQVKEKDKFRFTPKTIDGERSSLIRDSTRYIEIVIPEESDPVLDELYNEAIWAWGYTAGSGFEFSINTFKVSSTKDSLYEQILQCEKQSYEDNGGEVQYTRYYCDGEDRCIVVVQRNFRVLY